jgi:hypothetical protein
MPTSIHKPRKNVNREEEQNKGEERRKKRGYQHHPALQRQTSRN